MLFDKLCGLAERHLNAGPLQFVFDLCRKAQLFDFPVRAHELFVAEEIVELSDPELLNQFVLPFPVVAIEDTASCVLLWDQIDQNIGFDRPRGYVEIQDTVGARMGEYRHHIGESDTVGEDIFIVSIGSLLRSSIITDPGSEHFGGVHTEATDYQRLRIHRRDGKIDHDVLDSDSCELLLTIAREACLNAGTALKELAYCNNPSRFIVERAPVRPRDQKKGRILRSDDRPRFTLLTPSEIQERWAKVGGRAVAEKIDPHPRRRHWRTLRSERFTHAKNSKLLIPATWVGPKSVVAANHRYEVRLDL